MANILIVEDNETMREGMEKVITKMGHHVVGASSGAEGLERFDEETFDFVLTDLKMEPIDGMEVLTRIREKAPEQLVMILTAYGSIETAVESMRKGAFDFITKPFSQDYLRMKVNQALEMVQLSRDRQRLTQTTEYFREEERREYNFEEIVGDSSKMEEIFSTIRKVAGGGSTVFIYGESGTGKELIARAIHYHSDRAEGPFIKLSCSALAEGVLESELFGHEKGSFTGAVRRKLGRFELAHKGTLFLDEIGDISPLIQLKLLRVLQEREFERVGGTQPIKIDVRVITATNKDLLEEIRKNNFREDLYYRLHIVPIKVPPLRERKEDIPPLVEHFITKLGKRTNKKVRMIDEEAMNVLMEYYWPGNIRELENIIEQSMVLTDGEVIRASDLPMFMAIDRPRGDLESQLGTRPLPEIVDEIERDLIKAAYGRANGVKTETAKLLGIKTSALYYKLEKYGLIQEKGET
ncbi:MAG: sigma-54 dependent transcriptional regulator [Candidatus Alcyoniella australis]|nr:sigma-54 dependent transcriptional regulator [Candidatus Alcyoniella australis]